MRRKIILAGLLVVGVFGAGCLDDSITGTRPVTLSIAAESETAAVGDPVTVSFSATGTGLISVTMDWGDGGVIDTVSLGGQPVEAAGRVEHTYSEAGSYTITGTASASNGTASSQTTVQIS